MSANPPFLRGGNLKRSLAKTLNGLLLDVSPDEMRAARDAVAAATLEKGLFYEEDDGTAKPIPIMLRPRVIGGNQRAYLHDIARVMDGAYVQLYRLWREHTRVREVLPLNEVELRWMRDLAVPDDMPQVQFGRFDCSTDFGTPDWVRSTQLFEYNPIGSGGTYLAPACDDIVLQHVVPLMRRQAPTLLLEPNDEPRKVLLETLADHARSLRLTRFNVALSQIKGDRGGVDEFPKHEEYFRSLGVQTWHVDPRELRLVGDEIRYGDVPIDLVYRDEEIATLAALEAEGADLSALKHALRTGRCVPSLSGELDHKSAFQIFTCHEFETWFSAAERRVFHRHVPWTRRVKESRTTDPDDHEIDLMPWLLKNRERMVLKPNRSYGGGGVTLGRECDDAQWQSYLDTALREPDGWVVQGYRPVAEKDFPVIGEDGELRLEEFFSVLGLFASTQRLAILGRAARRKVVNVGQRGGLVAVLRLL